MSVNGPPGLSKLVNGGVPDTLPLQISPDTLCAILWLNPWAKNGHQDGHQTHRRYPRFSGLAWCPFWCPFFDQTG